MQLQRSHRRPMGCRHGTALGLSSVLAAVLGQPDKVSSVDRKITTSWVFETPRGTAEVRDYRWNHPIEWTIAASSHKAAMYLARYLRQLGVPATTKEDLSGSAFLRRNGFDHV